MCKNNQGCCLEFSSSLDKHTVYAKPHFNSGRTFSCSLATPRESGGLVKLSGWKDPEETVHLPLRSQQGYIALWCAFPITMMSLCFIGKYYFTTEQLKCIINRNRAQDRWCGDSKVGETFRRIVKGFKRLNMDRELSSWFFVVYILQAFTALNKMSIGQTSV